MKHYSYAKIFFAITLSLSFSTQASLQEETVDTPAAKILATGSALGAAALLMSLPCTRMMRTTTSPHAIFTQAEAEQFCTMKNLVLTIALAPTVAYITYKSTHKVRSALGRAYNFFFAENTPAPVNQPQALLFGVLQGPAQLQADIARPLPGAISRTKFLRPL